MTLSTYAAKWLKYAAQGRAAGTIRRYGATLRALCAELGELELARVRADDLKAWQMRRSEAVAPATLVVDIVVVQALFSTAAEDGEIPVDPSRSLKKPPLPLQAEELGVTWEGAREAIGEYSENPERAALLLLLSTGLRLGELTHLRPEDVADGFVRVRPHPDWRPKTRSSTRRIPVNPISKAAIKALATGGQNGRLCHVGAYRLRRALEDVCAEAGIPRLTPHRCRHLFLTHCAEVGMPPEVMRRLAGHASLKMVLAYTHLGDEALRGAMEKFQ